ncbi:hypothetical protein ACOSQ2_022529 [Xanthoceras sorbifolium]
MGEDEENDQEIDTENDEVQEEFIPEISREEMSISHHALTGCAGLQTIRLRGRVKHREITILVDSGSTYNFLDPNTAQLTGVEIEKTETLWVTVGGGGKTSSKAKCKEFTLAMQGVTFSTEMRLLTLGDCDAVLGMQWIKEIGPIMLNAKQLSMSFMKEGKWVSLQGIRTESKLTHLTGKKVGSQLKKAHKQAEAVVQLYSLETEEKMGILRKDGVIYVGGYGNLRQKLRKMVKKHNKAVVQYLIQWSTTSPDDATWEDAEMICKSFPSFDP